MTRLWNCQICHQVVELRDDDRPRWSVKAYENCKLQYHYMNNSCIAYRDPKVAKELITMQAKSICRPRLGVPVR